MLGRLGIIGRLYSGGKLLIDYFLFSIDYFII